MATCWVEGCANESGVPGSARGLCRAHYRRWQRYGDEKEPIRKIVSWKGEICAEEGCEENVLVHGLCQNHYAKVRYRNNPETQKKRNLAFKERKRLQQEEEMGRPRPLRCEICNDEGYGRKPSIVFDHCHSTGNPRGWLCDRCNKVLGLVKDKVSLLLELAIYLEYHSDKANDETKERSA